MQMQVAPESTEVDLSLVKREFVEVAASLESEVPAFEDITSSDAQDPTSGAEQWVKRLAATHGHAFFNGKHLMLDDVRPALFFSLKD